jgi:hypothetical protein
MLCGAALYAELYAGLKTNILKWGEFGKITIPSIIGINHWIIIACLVAIFIVLFRFFEKKNL